MTLAALLLLLPTPFGPFDPPGPPDPPVAPVAAASPAPATPAAPRGLEVVELGQRWRMMLGPDVDFYPPYLADPRRPTFALTSVHSNSELAGAGTTRFGLRIGTRLELLRFYERDRPEGGVHVDGEVGILAQFDRDNSTDNLGWDGIYALHVSWLACEGLALRVGAAHDSSHLGDEFIESTGATRLMYTREEFVGGLSWRIADEWRAYGEYGHAYDLRNPALMDDGRAQVGLEYQAARSPWNGRSRPYAGLDVGLYQEDRWQPNWNFQTGVRLDVTNGAVWRLGVELYDGRSIIGEHFQARETHFAWGLWIDV